MSIAFTPRDRKILTWIALVVGTLLTAGGLFGIWLQGMFYNGGFPTAATFGEVRAAFTWPTATTTLGSLIVGGMILASPLTDSWPLRRRVIVFGVLVLAGCAICGPRVAARVSNILR